MRRIDWFDMAGSSANQRGGVLKFRKSEEIQSPG